MSSQPGAVLWARSALPPGLGSSPGASGRSTGLSWAVSNQGLAVTLLPLPRPVCQQPQSCSLPCPCLSPESDSAVALMDELHAEEVSALPGGAVCLQLGRGDGAAGKVSRAASRAPLLPQGAGRGAGRAAGPVPRAAKAKRALSVCFPSGLSSLGTGLPGEELGAPLHWAPSRGLFWGPLPSAGHRAPVLKRLCGCRSEGRWPCPAGVAALPHEAGSGGRGGPFACSCRGYPALGLLGGGPVNQSDLSGPCRTLGRATWRRARRCTPRCARRGKR